MSILNKQKVSEIEFHLQNCEIDDFILRAAELIKDGYTLYEIKNDAKIDWFHNEEPYIHIKFTRY